MATEKQRAEEERQKYLKDKKKSESGAQGGKAGTGKPKKKGAKKAKAAAGPKPAAKEKPCKEKALFRIKAGKHIFLACPAHFKLVLAQLVEKKEDPSLTVIEKPGPTCQYKP